MEEYIRVKVGSIEIEYSGTQGFPKEIIFDLMKAISEEFGIHNVEFSS